MMLGKGGKKVMKSLLLVLLLALPLSAQDIVVQIPVTVNVDFAPAVTAWVNSLCSETDEDGVCIVRPYNNAIDLVSKVAQQEVDRVIRSIITWATTNDPTLLPLAMQDALAAKATAEAEIAALKDGATQ